MLNLMFMSLILGILILLMMNKKNEMLIKKFSLILSILIFFQSILIWMMFDNSILNFQFLMNFEIFNFLTISFGIDSLNLYFILLTTFLTPFLILASWNNIKKNLKMFFILNFLIEFFLLMIFSVMDILSFYIAFESVLIPLFIMVGYWGGSEKKISASFLLFMYTLMGSLFMLLSIMILYNNFKTLNYNLLKNMEINKNLQIFLFFNFFLAFAIKTPLMPFHMWLPRAHAEAPLAGSMVLAGTVLKTATYGFLSIVIPLFPFGVDFFFPFIYMIFLTTLIYSSLSTIRQSDTKALIAYSSIAHMSVICMGLFSNTVQGIEGAILLSLAHGFVSPALFMIVGGILYDRYHTRTIKIYRGLFLNFPIMNFFFFFFTCANIGVPLSLNWLGEFFCLMGIFKINFFIGFLSSFSILLSSCYGVWLWARMSGGQFSNILPLSIDVNRREFMILFVFMFFTLFFGIFPNFILNDIHFNISSILFSNF